MVAHAARSIASSLPSVVSSSPPSPFRSQLVLVEHRVFSYPPPPGSILRAHSESVLRLGGTAESVRATLEQLPAILQAHGFARERNADGTPHEEQWQSPHGARPQDHLDWKGLWFKQGGPHVFVYAQLVQHETPRAGSSSLAIVNVPPELEAALRTAFL